MLAVARQLVSGALRPLVEEASEDVEEGEAARAVVSVRQRLRDLESALASCDAHAKLPEARLIAPEAVVEALARSKGDDDETLAALVSGNDVAEACAAAVALWARQARELAALVDTAAKDSGALAFPRSLEAEIGLWRDYEAALRRAAQARTSRAARCMSAALKRSKRFVAAAQLEDGVASLSRALDVAQDANKILAELPAADIDAASSLAPALADAAQKLFLHLAKLRASRHYAVRRATYLVEQASAAIGSRAARLLADAEPLALSLDACAKTLDDADAAFGATRKGVRKFRELAAELTRRDASSGTVLLHHHKELALPHEALESRVAEIREFRTTHHAFREALAAVLQAGGVDDRHRRNKLGAPSRLASEDDDDALGRDALGELDAAYARLAKNTSTTARDELPALVDASAEGSARWRSALSEYSRRVDKAEALAAARLSARLDAAGSADETFDVFARFQPLLDRPPVRRAAQRHQAALVDHVRSRVEALRDACTKRYEGSNAEAISVARDAPRLAAKIVWAKQVERRLRRQMARLRDVLGGQDTADRHPSGRALKTVADELLRHLDAQPLFEAWLEEWKKAASSSLGGRSATSKRSRSLLLQVVAQQKDSRLSLSVNFDESRAALYKEVRQLRWLGFRVPETIALVGDEARERYPIAVALDAAARAYSVARETARHHRPLVAPWLRAVRDRVGLAFPRRSASSATKLHAPKVSWTSSIQSVRSWVDSLSEDISALQEKLDILRDASFRFETAAATLPDTDDNNDLSARHGELQDVIDRLSLEGFEALTEWTEHAHRTVLKALRDRVARRLERAFGTGSRDDANVVSIHALSVRASDGMAARLSLEPPLATARRRWYAQLAAEVSAAAELPVLRATRFEALDDEGAAAAALSTTIYGDAIYRCSKEEHAQLGAALEVAVATIEGAAAAARERIAAWAPYLVVWHRSVSEVADHLDYGNRPVEALERWTAMARDATRARSELDELFTAEDERREALSTSPAVAVAIDARSAKDRVRPRFDAWLRELRVELGARVATLAIEKHEKYRAARDSLEQVDARSCPCRLALDAMAKCDELAASRPDSLRAVEVLEAVEPLVPLEFRRNQWLEVSRVRGAFEELDQLQARKAAALRQRSTALRDDLERELDRASRSAKRLSDRWRRLRPERLADIAITIPPEDLKKVAAPTDPKNALNALAAFGEEIESAKRDVDALERAGTALEGERDAAFESPAKHIALELDAIRARELPALVEVWQRVAPAADACARFDATRWSAFDPDAARVAMREASNDLENDVPARVRQYLAFADAQVAITLRERALGTLADIKQAPKLSDAAWSKVAAVLTPSTRWDPATCKLGDLVVKTQDTDVKGVIDAVLVSARADAALSDFLDNVKRYWDTAELEVLAGDGGSSLSSSRRRGPQRLITGWDALFAKLDEDSTGLRAMRQSPHFRRAVAEGTGVDIAVRRDELELSCDELRRRLELWADAQRRWVHLNAVRSSIGDRLRGAAAKFNEADRIFSTVRAETLVGDHPAVKLVLVSHKLPDQLAAVSSLLAEAQHALGEYLEGCRAKFARFYFVGDDDLLYVLGASGDAVAHRLSPYLGKMFQALDAVISMPNSNGSNVANAPAAMCSPDGVELVKVNLSLEGGDVSGTNGPTADSDPESVRWLRTLEQAMRAAVARDAAEALESLPAADDLVQWLAPRTAQAVMVSVDVAWVRQVERAVGTSSLEKLRAAVRAQLDRLCATPVAETTVAMRKRELCIVEFSRQRDVVDHLILESVKDTSDWIWARLVKLYAGPAVKDAVADCAFVEDPPENVGFPAIGRCIDAALTYGWEYQGVGARLVRTPLTDRCFVTLAQALRLRLGASPVGPAGTGKTESVKAFGSLLGRLVICFNCDESYSVPAMRRLLRGICATGAFACFDELNRLSEGMLSAVSEMVRQIQLAQKQKLSVVELGHKSAASVPLKATSAVFITLNPSYAGRSPLPETLKSLFRQVSMVRPDSTIIARTSLLAHGFNEQETLEVAGNLVSLMQMCKDQLSSRSWYDFGLRSLAPVVARAGELRRRGLCEDAAGALFASLRATFAPRLIESDVEPFAGLLKACFPSAAARSAIAKATVINGVKEMTPSVKDALMDHVDEVALEEALSRAALNIGAYPSKKWVDKAAQLRTVLSLSRGAVIVGESGCGKTLIWRGLAAALEMLDSIPTSLYVIDPKALIAHNYKDVLIGHLDETTLEWQDGLLSLFLRGIAGGGCNTANKRHFIVFDGDVDPEWAENLNSVLDDNRLLTLANGERIAIPESVRFLFEVDDLAKATPATVSRCGVLHVDSGLVTVGERAIAALNVFAAEATTEVEKAFSKAVEMVLGGAVSTAAEWILTSDAIVPFACGASQVLHGALALCREAREKAVESGLSADGALDTFARRAAISSTFWAAAAPSSEDDRRALADKLVNLVSDDAPSSNLFDMRLEARARRGLTGSDVERDDFWIHWQDQAEPTAYVETFDTVVSTADTARNEWLLDALSRYDAPNPLLCGPPGSGKTMTVEQSLTKRGDSFAFVPLACASGTKTGDIAQLLVEHCELVRDGEQWTLVPKRNLYGETRTVVVFLDEINLVAPDAYGTARALALVRQIMQHGGFWALSTQSAGAALEPMRLARHLLVMRVGTPSRSSLERIFSAYAEHALRPADVEDLHQRRLLTPVTLAEAMIDVYEANAMRFSGTAPQCVYSARDITRWCRRMRGALEEAMASSSWEMLLNGLPLDSALIRLWAHEGLRLFSDRLPQRDDREWVADCIDDVAQSRFPQDALGGGGHGTDYVALRRPLLFSRLLSRSYAPSRRADLKYFMSSRLRTFYEEERSSLAPLVVFDDVVDHVLRIDAVLRSESGHVLLIGESGCGKSVLTRFVAWNIGLEMVEVRATKSYTLAKFDEELKGVMRRAGIEGERICLVIDEADAVSSAFLERMNALLASGEVPGLWSNEEMTKLLAACREQRASSSISNAAGRLGSASGSSGDDDDAVVIEWFNKRVRRNLHAVFTLNPGPGARGQALLGNRATASPALFNRCVTLWFGAWSPKALAQVANAYIRDADFGAMGADFWEERLSEKADVAESELLLEAVAVDEEDVDDEEPVENSERPEVTASERLRRAVVAALVGMHQFCAEHFEATARDFIELVRSWRSTCDAKWADETTAQRRRTAGLRQLAAARSSVASMQREEQDAIAKLEEQDAIAKSRLDRMLADQQEAEAKQRDGERLSTELERHASEIERRKAEAEDALAKAEPALQAARAAVRGIQKKQLDEVRALRNPPLAVRRTLEAVELLLGMLQCSSSYASPSWDDIRKLTRRGDFIATVVAFEPSQLSDKAATYVKERYLAPSEATLRELTKAVRLDDPDAKPIEALETTAVYKASKACGPLIEWAASQIEYAEIERRVEPLRREVAELEHENASTRQRVDALNEELGRLSESVAAYKGEYALAIRLAEQIKASMALGKQKADRAGRLLGSLESEQARWEAEARDFPERVAHLPTNALRSAVAIAYAGRLGDFERRSLADRVDEILSELGLSTTIEHKPQQRAFSVATYSINAATTREWHDRFGLARDERHLENAAILALSSRFALLVDPSGSAVRFVEAMLAARLSVSTVDSADPNLIKTLATAARFGSAVIVRGVDDYWDSIVHPLLEQQPKAKRRPSVKLGVELVDVSADFLILLHARDMHSVRNALPLGLLGRVVVLDFSTSQHSLESTILSRLLRVERPDLERQRLEAVSDLDQQRVRLTQLEDEVLRHISSSEERQSSHTVDDGKTTVKSILDDDVAVRALEQTTAEALALREESLKSEAAIAELGVATRAYAPIASCFADAYQVLARLRSLHFAYEFSLSFFLDNVLTPALRKLEPSNRTESVAELWERISQPFLQEYSMRISRGLLRHEHRLAAALALSRLVLEAQGSDDTKGKLIQFALTEDVVDDVIKSDDDAAVRCALELSTDERAVSPDALRALARESDFFRKHIEASSLSSVDADEDAVLTAARKAALARAVSPETVAPRIADLVRAALGHDCAEAWLSPESTVSAAALDATTHANEVDAVQQRKRRRKGGHDTPLDALGLEADFEVAAAPSVVVLGEVGRDGSRDVEAARACASAGGDQLEAIAMGASDSRERADAALRRCAEKGRWLLLKNAHLADRAWLEGVERKLRAVAHSATRGFCVFLAAEANPAKPLPKHLLARSHKVALGAEIGIRQALRRHAELVPDWTRPPAERARIYALLGWMHAVATERVRYSGRGWSKAYEWSDVDAICSIAAADAVLDPNTPHVAPEHLNWETLAGVIVATYGARLENETDDMALKALATELLSPDAFAASFKPIPQVPSWPDGARFSPAAWRAWIDALPPDNSCEWLGLGTEAELHRSARALQELSEAHAKLWQPSSIATRSVTTQNSVEAAADLGSLLAALQQDKDALSLAERELRRQASLETQAAAPSRRHTAMLTRAIADGIIRLGALRNPSRLLTAAQLDAAHHFGASVDHLQLIIDLDTAENHPAPPGVLRVEGLVARGASWRDSALSLAPGKVDQTGGAHLPEVVLAWRLKDDVVSPAVKLPLQLAQSDILVSHLLVPTKEIPRRLYLRNVVIEALP